MIEESSCPQVANTCVFMPEKRLLGRQCVWRPACYLFEVGLSGARQHS
jgi:hypothetical protein